MVQRVNGAVQATPLLQQGWPATPQSPLSQPPAMQVPWLLLHWLPAPMHWNVELSQQSPAWHQLPSQQNVPPGRMAHCSHLPLKQTAPDSVQKSAAPPPPAQQLSPIPPQLEVMPAQ